MQAENWARLVTAYRGKLNAAQQAEDVPTLLDASEKLWMGLAETTGNRRLIAMYIRLVDELRRVFRLFFQDPVAAGELAGAGGQEDWLPIGGPDEGRAYIEQYIDTAHRGPG
jgi:DNA-binding GntR family transcriptional regulator